MADIPLVTHPQSPANKDSAKRLVSDAGLKFARPWISAGSLHFVWPVGAESFRISGQATNAVHHYIGGNTPDVQTIHFHEGRIEISGTLPGLTSPENMVSLQDIVTSRSRKMLALPGVLPKVQYVVVDSYEFNRDENDRTNSIAYSITLIRVGTAGTSKGPGVVGSTLDSAQAPGSAPSTAQRASKSQSSRTYTTTQTIRTFRAVSDKVYGDVNLWTKLVDLNRNTLINNNPALKGVNQYQLPYYRWPVGTRIAY